MQTAQASQDAPAVETGMDTDMNADMKADLNASNGTHSAAPQGKLDDAEIARLVALTRDANYSQSNAIPVKPVSSFRPRTLVEIAMEAQQRRELAEAEAALKHDETSDAAGAGDNAAIPTEMRAENATIDAGGTSGSLTEGVSAGVPDTAASGASAVSPLDGDAGPENDVELSLEEIAAAEQAAALRAQFEKGRAEGFETGQEQAHKSGYEKGFEAGRNAGQAEAAAQLESSIQAFERAVASVVNPDALDVSAVSAHIRDAVLGLASERAGQAISELPDAFAARIEAIIATIKSASGAPLLSLNPKDLSSLKPIIETREKLSSCRIEEDVRLARGDVRVTLDGIGVEDMIDARVSRPAVTPPAETVTSPEANAPAERKGDDAGLGGDDVPAEDKAVPDEPDAS